MTKLRSLLSLLRYEWISQTEARERLKAKQPPSAPIRPTWRVQVQRKPKSIEEWKQQNERRRA